MRNMKSKMKSLGRLLAGAAGVAFVGVAGVGDAAVTVGAQGVNLTVTMSADGDTLTVTKPANNDMNFFDGTTNVIRTTNGGTGVQNVTVNNTSGGGVTVILDESGRVFTHNVGGGGPVSFTINGGAGADSVTCIPVTATGISAVPVVFAAGAGSDSFTISSGAPNVTAKGLSITGAGAVSLTGFTNAKSATGLETLDYDANGQAITVTVSDGSGAANTMVVGPTSATAAIASVNGVNVNLVDIGATPTYAGGGQTGDQLTVLGRDGVQDTIVIGNTSFSIAGLLGGNITGFDTALIEGGDEAIPNGDNITITAGTTLALTIDGGGPGGLSTDPGDSVTTNGVSATLIGVETVDGSLVPVTVSEIEIE